MNDELDPGLRRLFVATAESPADDGFIGAVTVVTRRQRRLQLLVRALAGVAILVAVAVAMSAGLEGAFNQGLGEIAVVLSASPLGWVAGLALAFAGAVCIRALAPLVRLRRP